MKGSLENTDYWQDGDCTATRQSRTVSEQNLCFYHCLREPQHCSSGLAARWQRLTPWLALRQFSFAQPIAPVHDQGALGSLSSLPPTS